VALAAYHCDAQHIICFETVHFEGYQEMWRGFDLTAASLHKISIVKQRMIAPI
jgi:hypothetical protein